MDEPRVEEDGEGRGTVTANVESERGADERVGVEALQAAESEKDGFGAAFIAAERAGRRAGELVASKGGEPVVEGRRVFPPEWGGGDRGSTGWRVRAVGAGSEAEPVAAEPVVLVVASATAAKGKIRNLVMLVADVKNALAGPEVHLGLEVVVGQGEAIGRQQGVKRGAGVDRQSVERDVFGVPSDGFLEGGHPGVEGLIGKAEHEIEGEVVEGSVACASEGASDEGCGVSTSNLDQKSVVKRLDADGKAVDPGGAPGSKARRGQGLRVGFEGDLAVGKKGKAAADGVQDRGKMRGLEGGWCPTAEVNGGKRAN